MFTYNVKVINNSKKSVYDIRLLAHKQHFSSLSDLKMCVQEEIGPVMNDTMGFIEPGHGKKGKIRELCTEEDLSEMYVLYKRKREVLLWCYGDVGEQSTVLVRKRSSQTIDDSAPHLRGKLLLKVSVKLKRSSKS